LPLRSCQRTFLYENKTNKWRASDVGRNGKRNGMSMRRLVSSRRSRCSARAIRADRARADCGARSAPSDACASRRPQGRKKLQGALQGEISNLLLSVKGKVSRAKRARQNDVYVATRRGERDEKRRCQSGGTSFASTPLKTLSARLLLEPAVQVDLLRVIYYLD